MCWNPFREVEGLRVAEVDTLTYTIGRRFYRRFLTVRDHKYRNQLEEGVTGSQQDTLGILYRLNYNHRNLHSNTLYDTQDKIQERERDR